jgi:hypothetical protein
MLRDPSIRIGHIGLQSNEGRVVFRNIRLRPIGVAPVLNEADLTGWSTAGAERSRFEVTERGELHVANGPGHLATEAEYTNFILQLECKVNGDRLNSGVFFRALRPQGTKHGRVDGYECQIHNGFKNGDRTKPSDFGTGAIYRRQAARRVVANDREWFAMTLVADGPHMATWVNGYQVTDWTDERPVKENPREGRRDGGGIIAIQGHDPTTDFLFREIKVGELPR